MTAKFPFTSVTSQKTNFNFTPHKPSRIRVPAARYEAVCVMNSDTHQRANQICKIGAAAEIPSPLLSGTGALPRNASYVREQISPCGTVDWRKRSTCKVAHFFWLFSFVQRKEHRFPLAKGIDPLRRRKNCHAPIKFAKSARLRKFRVPCFRVQVKPPETHRTFGNK